MPAKYDEFTVRVTTDGPAALISVHGAKYRENAEMITLALETAAERDRLRALNAELIVALDTLQRTVIREIESGTGWFADSQLAQATAVLAKAREAG